jgi:hypothetical protein
MKKGAMLSYETMSISKEIEDMKKNINKNFRTEK